MLSKTKLILAIVSTGLLGTILPPSHSSPNFNNESNYINSLDKLIKKNNSDTYIPKDKLDEYLIKGATYSTKFVPLMNDGSGGSEYTNLMANDGKRLLVDAGFNFLIVLLIVEFKVFHFLLKHQLIFQAEKNLIQAFHLIV